MKRRPIQEYKLNLLDRYSTSRGKKSKKATCCIDVRHI
jgi:hypothetical protein